MHFNLGADGKKIGSSILKEIQFNYAAPTIKYICSALLITTVPV